MIGIAAHWLAVLVNKAYTAIPLAVLLNALFDARKKVLVLHIRRHIKIVEILKVHGVPPLG